VRTGWIHDEILHGLLAAAGSSATPRSTRVLVSLHSKQWQQAPPCLVGDYGTARELFADTALLVNRVDTDAIAEGLVWWLSVQGWFRKGDTRAQQFTWDVWRGLPYEPTRSLSALNSRFLRPLKVRLGSSCDDTMTDQDSTARDRVPRVMVMATHAERIGGIERVTRSLLMALSDVFGVERVGLLSVWEETRDQPCTTLYRGRGTDGGRVGVSARLSFTMAALRGARRWNDGLVIIACHPHLAPVAWLAGILYRVPYVVWCHGEEVWGRLRPSVTWSLRKADAIFAPSNFTARRVETTAGLEKDSVLVIPHCLPPEMTHLRHIDHTTVPQRVLTVSRLSREHTYKGIDTLIGVWPQVQEQVPGAELVIVGDGSDRRRLENLANRSGVESTIVFVGAAHDEELARHYSTAAIFALPSHTSFDPPQGEGFGLVYVEAGAAGMAVIGERDGAVAEVIAHNQTGLSVEPRSQRALASALCRLLSDPDLTLRMGQAGRRRALTKCAYETFRARIVGLIRDVAVSNPEARG
jgi:phosphatidylinositol alpha-1,6-mannosyltransferase